MRVGRMVRQLVEGCSEVVHVARLAAVVKVVEGIVSAGGCRLRRSGVIWKALLVPSTASSVSTACWVVRTW